MVPQTPADGALELPFFVCPLVHIPNHRIIPPPHKSRASGLVEEANDLAGDVLAAGLLVVHDASGGGEDDVAELTGGEELDNPLLELAETDVVAGGDDTALVEAAVELDDDLAVTVVIDLLELANVACRDRRVREMLREFKGWVIIGFSENL